LAVFGFSPAGGTLPDVFFSRRRILLRRKPGYCAFKASARGSLRADALMKRESVTFNGNIGR
jgi:hypothetical protein